MPIFRVIAEEVWIRSFLVEAEDEDAALQRVVFHHDEAGEDIQAEDHYMKGFTYPQGWSVMNVEAEMLAAQALQAVAIHGAATWNTPEERQQSLHSLEDVAMEVAQALARLSEEAE
jgi:hypothetical protein